MVNPLLGLLFLNQILSGIFADRLPHARFGVLHEGGGILFAILNWPWIKANFFRKPTPIAGE